MVGQSSISAVGSPDETGVLAARVMLPVSIDGRHAYELTLVMPALTMQAIADARPAAGWAGSPVSPTPPTRRCRQHAGELQRYIDDG